ncbi:MAG: hypothetical protein LBE48_05635 [Methanomassiliicoccaceae archaeon]|jgi:hypothetical protein|nr:hypothetical protein [Methanomassiliicoccaceae archaeon]
MTASILFTVSFAIIIITADDTYPQYRDSSSSYDPRSIVFDDTWIPVSNPQELAWVGDDKSHTASNGITYTWSADEKYYLSGDIIFDPGNSGHDTNGGADTEVSATTSGTDMEIKLTPPPGMNIKLFQAWIGISNGESASDTVQLKDVPQGMYALVIGGIAEVGTVTHNFAYSQNIDTTAGMPINNIKFNSNGNFDPIGASDPFTGKFNGNGHVISGMNVAVFSDSESDVYAGLFGQILNAEVTDLGIVNSSVTMSAKHPYHSVYVGGIVGDLSSSSMTNCYNACTVAVSSSSYQPVCAGGIAGNATSSSMTKCCNFGDVTVSSPSSQTGGVAGCILLSSLTNCRNAGNVTASALNDLHLGGIAGNAESPMTGCYNSGSVTASSLNGQSRAGGIAGYTLSSITDCHNAGSVTLLSSYSYAGGIVGRATSAASISNCYNTGLITASSTASYAGGIAGHVRSTKVTNCYYLTGKLSVNGSPLADRLCGSGSPIRDGSSSDPLRKTNPDQTSGSKTEEQMRPSLENTQAEGGGNSIYYTGTTAADPSTVRGWDFYGTWTIVPNVNNGYPVLRQFSGMTVNFTEQPADKETTAGGTVTFSASAESSVLPRYQWFVSADDGKTWEPINGANGTSYTVGPVTNSDNGKKFRVSATLPDYESTTAYSDAAALYVGPYTVSLSSGEGYTLYPHTGSSSPVNCGGSFTFQFNIREGYTGTYKVFVNNAEVTLDANGIYTIENIRSAQTVTVNGTFTVRTYDVTLTPGNGYKLKEYGGSSSPVDHGGSFTFQFSVSEGYTAVSYKVFVNTTEVTLDADGRYTIENITTAQTVRAEGTFIWNTYDVMLTSGTGYTLSPHEGSSSPVDHGGSFTFQFNMNYGYTGTYKVFVNSVEVTLDADKRFTIENITAAQNVRVEGTFTLTPETGGGKAYDVNVNVWTIVSSIFAITCLIGLLIRRKERDQKEE